MGGWEVTDALKNSDEVRVSAVVPCFNEAPVLPELVRRLTAACEQAVGDDFEIVLVDDGSRDSTRAAIRAVQCADPRIVGVFLSRNHGHQLALSAGLAMSRGRRVFVLDADLQDPPELLSPMMARMDEGFDVVYGTRRSRTGEGAFKKGSAHYFYKLLTRMVEFEIPPDTGDFRLMSRRVVDVLLSMPERHRFIRGMVSWIGFQQTAFPYDRDSRHAGSTSYSLTKMILFAIDAITSFSILPLRIATIMGFLCAFSSILYAVYVILAWFAGDAVTGWASLAVLVLFLGGSQLIVAGIFGEYLGRLYMQSKARPLFVIEEVIRAEPVPRAVRESAAMNTHG